MILGSISSQPLPWHPAAPLLKVHVKGCLGGPVGECPTSAQVVISRFMGSSPASTCCCQSRACFGPSDPFSLYPSPTHTLSQKKPPKNLGHNAWCPLQLGREKRPPPLRKDRIPVTLLTPAPQPWETESWDPGIRAGATIAEQTAPPATRRKQTSPESGLLTKWVTLQQKSNNKSRAGSALCRWQSFWSLPGSPRPGQDCSLTEEWLPA